MEKPVIEKKVKTILKRQLAKRGLNLEVKNTDSLINYGIIDSLGAVELVSELEKEFKIEILPEEMTEANFDSIEKMVSLLDGKLA